MQSLREYSRLNNLFILILLITFSSFSNAKVIKKIHIDDEKMQKLVKLKEGEEYSPEKGVETIKSLFKTGFFSNVEIFKIDNENDTIDINIKLTKRILFTKPIVKGKYKIKKKKITHFLNLNDIRGKEYNEDNFYNFILAFKDYLSTLGYPDAELEYNLKFLNENSEVEPIIFIHYGKPVVVGKVSTDCIILKNLLDLKKGDDFDTNQLNHDIKKSKALLVEEKYYNAKFTVETDVKNGTANININVLKGEKYNYKVENFKLSKDEEEKVFRFFKRGDLDKFSLNYIKKNLEHLAMVKGYFKPEFLVNLKGNSLTCNFLNPIRKKIDLITFNISIKVNTENYKFYNSLIEESIKQDILKILKEKGHENPIIKTSFDEKKKILHFDITEGELLKIGKVNINKQNDLKIDYLKNKITGMIYSQITIGKYINGIYNELKDKGFYDIEINSQKGEIKDNLITLNLDISTVKPKNLTDIYIYGLKNIEKETVMQFIKFKVGDIFRETDIDLVKERLYSSLYFSEINVDSFEFLENKLILFIKLKEKDLYSMSYGFGVNSDEGLRIFGKVKKNYLMNKNLTGTLFARNSTKKSQLYLSIAGRYGFLSTLYYIFDDKNDYRFSKIGWSTSYSFKYSNGKTLILGVDFKKSNLSNLNVPEEEIEKEHFPDYTGKLIGRFLMDRRDDILYPSKGYFLEIKAEPSYDFDLNSTYFKFTEKSAFYFGNFAISQTIGSIFSKNGDFRDTPIPERFFIGGANNLRISSFEKAGPLFSNGAPKGGEFLALITAEYRFNLTDDIGATIFIDVGNVWNDSSYAGFSTAIKDAGFGLWYRTPLGPIKLELAFNLDKDVFSTNKRLVFSIGHSF